MAALVLCQEGPEWQQWLCEMKVPNGISGRKALNDFNDTEEVREQQAQMKFII